MGDEEGTVQNPYRAAVQGRSGDSYDDLSDFTTELDDAKKAMDKGAWVSSAADDFYTELTEQITALNNAAEGAETEFSETIENQPEKVEPDAWQTHWRNL
ncbi:hypothetical protein CLV30_12070 [Haloactinopolyspora alba]|uniref:Uncharacterized protein n=1 Tax=Haloactinopolyspora alba TaxID=648780 RepID=A0A2P8DM53_9ACTN|nr:hypothetical protein [Haloactinopolyspora alba]PSK98284.1 hypothetical protein CLV30_12070 [Haloactinopolyspora alba]